MKNLKTIPLCLLYLLFFCWGISIAQICQAESHKIGSIPISDKYFNGSFLIYECREKYWACVGEYGYELCKLQRETSIKRYDRVLACGPIKKFKTYDDCLKMQRQKIAMSGSLEFCLNPARRN